MLHVDAVLNSKKIAEIINTGYTRIPVYENDRNHIVSLLNVKGASLQMTFAKFLELTTTNVHFCCLFSH